MTYQQVVAKVACPTCGAALGKPCEAGGGRMRPEPHADRTVAASKGTFSSSKHAFGSMMSVFKKKS